METFSLLLILALGAVLQVSLGLSTTIATKYARNSPLSLHNLYRDVASLVSVTSVLRCAASCHRHPSCTHFFYSPIALGCVLVAVDPNMPLVSQEVYETWDFYTSSASTGCYHIYNRELSLCVSFSEDALSWDDARTACVNKNARLAILNTEEKFQWIRNLILRGQLAPNYSVGGLRLYGVFQWFFGFNVLSSMWGLDQPDNLSGEEDCLCIMSASLYYLNDCGCYYWSLAYICEY